MLRQVAKPFTLLRSWFGGWSLLLLVVVVVGIVLGLRWEQQRQVPVPPGATQTNESIVGDVRQTTYRYPGSVADILAFYRQALPPRGWRYCGTQTTARCTNMIRLNTGADQVIDVYRRADDQNFQGATVEVWPVQTQDGQTYVTVFETRGR